MKKNLLLLIAIVFAMVSCGQDNIQLVNVLNGRDSKSPVLESVCCIDEFTVCLTFNEKIAVSGNSFDNCSTREQGCDLYLEISSALKPGKSYTLSGRVCDLNGNSTRVSVEVWGYNPNPASLIINEFTTKGSATSPDRTELYIGGSGSLAGLCLYDGIPGNYRSCVIFDDVYVNSGSYVVVWWTDKLPLGVEEHPSDTVYNICAKSSINLSENNGILTLASSPSEGASILNCVAYSSFESSEYSGFGTKEVFDRVQTAQNKGWLTSEIVSSKNSTATRSISRKNDNTWYITVNSGSSFGSANTSAPFT